MNAESPHDRTPLLAALAVVALALSGLLVGYEPIDGDPDNLYRPIKSELSRALSRGTLPFWSDRFGVGAPLVAESHVAAFYPPNWLLYGALGVSHAYRLEMGLHYLALVLATYGYARVLGLTRWGGAMSALAFSLCGYQASHACHEPLYVELPYLPLALMLAERYLVVVGFARLATLALVLGAQVMVGHFQIQMWTCGLVLLTAFWRCASGAASWRRGAALGMAVGWGLAIASVQLGLTWELTKVTGFNRPTKFLMNYSFPPANWAQLVLPKLFMGFREGSRAAYWAKQETTADEACLYVGTVPLILAAAGYLAPRDRSLAPWRWLAPLGLLLATLPRLWPEGFELLLRLPGFGHFRAPGRYTLLTCLGLSLLAGRGFDRGLPPRRFWLGVALAVLLAVTGFAWGMSWIDRPDVRELLGGHGGLDYLVGGLAAWCLGLVAVVAWRRGKSASGPWAPFVVAAAELVVLYHSGTTPWGWSIRFPETSPVFQRLLRESTVGLIAGRIHSLPVRAGLTPAYPYLSIFPPPPNYLLESSMFADKYSASLLPWLNRSGVTHGIFLGKEIFRPSETLYLGPDPALDAIIPYEGSTRPGPRLWRLERYEGAYPPAHLSRTVRVAADWYEMYPALSQADNPDDVWFLQADLPPDPPGPRARNARLLRWDGRSGEVEHDGTIDLVMRRTFYPGWTARLDDGPPVPVVPADGGFQSVRIPGSGTTRVTVSYRPTLLPRLGTVSLAATSAALLTLLGFVMRRRRGSEERPR